MAAAMELGKQCIDGERLENDYVTITCLLMELRSSTSPRSPPAEVLDAKLIQGFPGTGVYGNMGAEMLSTPAIRP
jgi:hypothetical protein